MSSSMTVACKRVEIVWPESRLRVVSNTCMPAMSGFVEQVMGGNYNLATWKFDQVEALVVTILTSFFAEGERPVVRIPGDEIPY